MTPDTSISRKGLDQSLLKWMQELSPHGVCITDAGLHVIGWNLWLQTASGLATEQVLGRGLVELFPDLRTRKLEDYFQRALAGEVIVLSAAFHGFLFPFPSPIPDTGEANMLQTARIAPLRHQGEIVGTVTTIEDVTEREYQNSVVRKQQERQELFSWALAHLLQSPNPESIIKEIFPRISAHIEVDHYFNYLLDADGKTLRLHSCGGCSAAFQKELSTLELSKTLRGDSTLDKESIVLCDVQNTTEEKCRLLRKLGLQSYVCHPLLVEDKLIGTLSFGSSSRKQFEPDEIEFTNIFAQYVAIALDRSRKVEALHAAQLELSRHADLLEKKVVERTSRLEESLAEMESFSYTLAHDVRAPLRHIRGFATLLKEECNDQLPPQGQTYVESILKGMQKLDSFTSDILSYSKVSRTALELKPVDLETVLSEIVTQQPALASPGVLTIKLPLHKPIAQKMLLGQCLSNLLNNAFKFTDKGISPQITIRTELVSGMESNLEQGSPSYVRIWVEDNGIGIPQQFHTKIFEIFERLNPEHQYEGTGIGLAIVAKAIHRMRGTLGVESNPEGGSRFWLQLPFKQKQGAAN